MNDITLGEPVPKKQFNLAFIIEMERVHFYSWDDGLRAALDYLVEHYGWKVDIYNLAIQSPNIPDDKDFYLYWGAFAKKQHERRFFPKQGLCFAGGPTYHPAINNFDIVFAESLVDYKNFKKMGVKTIQAFGTNTALFRPIKEQVKIFDYFYGAAYAKWKRHDRFIKRVKKEKARALTTGYMQPRGWEKDCYESCLKNGITVLPWVPYDAMPWLINMSKKTLITADADGGCQRLVLESKACGVPVEIDSDSPKLKELEKLSRKEVLKNWSESSYAEKLKQGIEEVMSGK